MAAVLLGVGSATHAAAPATEPVPPPVAFAAVPGGFGGTMLSVRCDTAPVLNVVPQFWNANFLWAGAGLRFGTREADGSLPFAFEVKDLAISGTGQVREVSPGTMQWTWDLNVARETPAIGPPGPAEAKGGLTFFLDLDSPARRGHAADPILKEGLTGWSWEATPGKTIDVQFERPLAQLYFEMNRPDQIRASFVAAPIAAGMYRQTMTMSMPGETQIEPTLQERYAFDPADGFDNAFDVDEWPVDLSYLNEKPAGTHGFARARGDALAFADGTPVRFWGTSIQGASVMPMVSGQYDRQRIDRQARRLARLGFNMIRLTQMDSWWCRPNLLGGAGPTSDRIDEQYLDAMHYLIAALKREGIYVQLDMTTYRPYFPGDNIPGFEEMVKHFGKDNQQKALAEGTMYLNARLRELWRLTTRELLTRTNPYTGLALTDDPAVAAVITLNENDLTNHFGNLYAGDKGVPYHQALFDEKLKAFAARTGLSEQELRRTWLPGPSKMLLNDMEYRWQADAAAYIRELGYGGLIITGHAWGGASAHMIPSLVSGDVTDAHMYSDEEFLASNPRVQPNFAHIMSIACVADRPTWISEYNMEESRRLYDTFTVMPYMATLAAFQGWDAPTLYGYSQDGFSGWHVSQWSSFDHPSVLALSPAAALIYRAGHVQPARETLFVPLTREGLFLTDVSASTSRTLRTAMERHGLCIGLPAVPELPWLQQTRAPEGAEIVTNPDRDLIPPGDYVEADTGEFRRDWGKGVFVVDSPRTQLVMGWTRGEWETADVRWTFRSPISGVSLSSLDDRPIRDSRRLVICSMGRMQLADRKPITEPVNARLELQSQCRSLSLVPLALTGARMAAMPLSQEGGRWIIDLPRDRQTHWFELEGR
jgi:hypothetical protein